MSETYTPTTEEVRIKYSWDSDSDKRIETRRAEFNSWLLKLLNEHRVNTWEEGRTAGVAEALGLAPSPNPYRQGENNE